MVKVPRIHDPLWSKDIAEDPQEWYAAHLDLVAGSSKNEVEMKLFRAEILFWGMKMHILGKTCPHRHLPLVIEPSNVISIPIWNFGSIQSQQCSSAALLGTKSTWHLHIFIEKEKAWISLVVCFKKAFVDNLLNLTNWIENWGLGEQLMIYPRQKRQWLLPRLTLFQLAWWLRARISILSPVIQASRLICEGNFQENKQ